MDRIYLHLGDFAGPMGKFEELDPFAAAQAVRTIGIQILNIGPRDTWIFGCHWSRKVQAFRKILAMVRPEERMDNFCGFEVH